MLLVLNTKVINNIIFSCFKIVNSEDILKISGGYMNELNTNTSNNSFYNWCKSNNREDLLLEWDYEKNGDITPYNISPGTDKKVWWIKHYDDPNTGKHFDFSWEATVSHRKDGRGCPYLSVPIKKIYPGFNDLSTTHPNLAKEWAKEENDKLNVKLSDVSYGSTKEVFWNCKIHGLFKAVISQRARGNGCPFCAGKQIKVGINDLKTMAPKISEEWDYEKNGVGPETVTMGSTKKYWWKCQKNHSWQATPNSRTCKNTGCPVCANKKIIAGINDLASSHPGLATEWNYEKNGSLNPTSVSTKSNRNVWWKCQLNHEYQARISARVIYNIGCPICNSERETSFPEQTIFYYVKKGFENAVSKAQFDWLGNSEIDIYIPDIKVGIEYDGGYWHKNKKDLEKDMLCLKHNIELIRIRDNECQDYETPAKVIKYGNNEIQNLKDALLILFKYLKEKYKSDIDIKIDIDNDYISIVNNFVFGIKENNLKIGRPDIAAEWDYEKNGKITPELVSLHSNKKFWFKCPKCGYSYKMPVGDRTGSKHSNCPACAGKVLVKGLNDLKTTNPALVNEWDYEKNVLLPEQVTKGSHKKVWWKCSKGHSWQTNIYVRAGMGSGCPYCAGQRVLLGQNDLLTLNPELCKEWDYNKNDSTPENYMPKSNKKVWWICKECGNSWQTAISHRTDGKGCPKCNQGGNFKRGFLSSNNDLRLDWDKDKNKDLNPDKLALGSKTRVWWKCHVCGYEWETTVGSRCVSNSKCPRCSNRIFTNR